MSDGLIRRETWMTRVWAWAAKALNLTPTDFRAGYDYSPGIPATASYDATAALSAYAGNPWVYAAINAIATDLSGLPIRVRASDAPDAQRIDTHPILDIIARPTSRTSGRAFRRQQITDLILTGEAPSLALPGDGARDVPPLGMVRLHPARVRPVPSAAGEVVEYEYIHGGVTKRYPAAQVMCPRLQSWEDDIRELHGTGATAALHRDLTADAALAKRAAASASSGKPSAIASPAKDGDIWDPKLVTQFKGALKSAFADSDGGVAILGGQAKLDVLGWSSLDLQIPEQRRFALEAIIAVTGCVPTRIGLVAANYAQSREQSVAYWQHILGMASLLDDEWTRFARMFPRSESVVVYHDASHIDALIESQDAKLTRAETLMYSFGVAPADALQYVGLPDVPVPDAAPSGAAVDPTAPLAPAAPQAVVADTGLNGAQIAALLAIVAAVSDGTLSEDGAIGAILVSFPSLDEQEARRIVAGAQPAVTPPTPPTPPQGGQASAQDVTTRALAPVDERAATLEWQGWVTRSQGPAERTLRNSVHRWLVGARKRTVQRATAHLKSGAVTVTKESGIDALLALIFPLQAERDELRAVIGDKLDRILSAALVRVARQLGIDPGDNPSAADLVDALTQRVTLTTLDDVRDVLVTGLDQGQSVADISRALQASSAFAPDRALTIARTESTRATNAGQHLAIGRGKAAGLKVRKRWLSSRDSAVRDAHAMLDGQVVAADAPFTYNGHSAQYPGDFEIAALDVNCRCTHIAVVDP